ncbi:hypothetical protein EBU99_01825 [bacterium]|nr:hypothetical protein [bacterium]
MARLRLTLLTIIPFFTLVNAPLGCVTIRANEPTKEWIQSTKTALELGCKSTSRGGFSADLSIPSQGSARIEAVWDATGYLSGQVINTLGEDLVNFKIDSSGVLQTDASLPRGSALSLALDFLAQIGAKRTRSLLCSGLFVAQNDLQLVAQHDKSNKTESVIEAGNFNWLLNSTLTPSDVDPQTVEVDSQIMSDSFLFRRILAKVNWKGKKQEERIRPFEMTIQAEQTIVKLLFLDFD